MDEFKSKLDESIHKLERWVEEHNYKGYEPFDGLSSRLRPLTFGNLFMDRLLLQLVRQSPWNLRPLMGIKPLESTKGRGYMASGYLTMYELTGDLTYRTRAESCLDWLIRNKSPKFKKFSWANHFDFASRGGRYTKDESIIVWTALIGHAFLSAYELLGEKKYLDVAVSVCDWIMDLPRERTENGTCISYYAVSQSSIHNSNMLGAAMLARTAKITGNPEYLKLANAAMDYSCTRQRKDGAWYYGEAEYHHWIDNFHSGYNLDSLKIYIDSTGDNRYLKNFEVGLEYFKSNFFEESGRPKYYHNRTYPVDSQCAAQAIESLANFSVDNPSSMALAKKVAIWWIENMQDENGFFYYREYPLLKAKTPMLHWAQATSYKALTLLFSKLKDR